MRRGIGAVEALVGVVITTALCGALAQLTRDAARGAARVDAAGDAMESALVAVETIRRDVRRAVWQQDGDLAIAAGGDAASMLVPAAPAGPAGDLWAVATAPVRYALQPFDSPAGPRHRLMRDAGAGARAVAGCTLARLDLALRAGAVEITAVGAGTLRSSSKYEARARVPVARIQLPAGYAVQVQL